ncbi:MAG: hypothetical protein E6I75_26630 [Chloroflexi bacterium]|nr:MAG: hypothetical protein E6I75_26630 [Chloroflexota bacterium]
MMRSTCSRLKASSAMGSVSSSRLAAAAQWLEAISQSSVPIAAGRRRLAAIEYLKSKDTQWYTDGNGKRRINGR